MSLHFEWQWYTWVLEYRDKFY